jgi:RNA polymerase sigma-70 factor (ECF subfamily)
MKAPEEPADPGHVAKVQALFVQHEPVVRGMILALLPDFDVVDDIVQETFLAVTKKAGTFELGTNFVGWVCAIARYKVLETLRRERRSFETLSEEVIEAVCATAPREESDFGGRVEVLNECIRHLSEHARRALELRYQQAHRLPEVAQRMGWTVESTKVMLSRVRATLRECIQRKIAAQKG